MDEDDVRKIVCNYLKEALEIEYKEEKGSYGEKGYKYIILKLDGEEISTTYI